MEHDAGTVDQLIRDAARRNGDRLAVEVVGQRRTYHELDQRSDRLAAGFASLGLAPGDRAAVLMVNSAANIESWFAMTKSGVVEVPINTANRGYLLTYMLSQSNSRAVVVDEELLDRVVAVAADCPELEHVVVHRSSTGPLTVDLPTRVVLHDLEDLYLDASAPNVRPSESDTAVLLYTSGTTGPSKGVLLPHRMNVKVARFTQETCRYGADDVLYTVFPLFHINAKYTSVLAAMQSDASLVMDARFSASGFLDRCREYGVTAFNYMGAMLTMLMKQPERDDDADNPITRAWGAPAPVEIWRAFEERFGVRLLETYGMTEMSAALQNTFEVSKVGSCGRPVPHFEVAIHDEADRPVPDGVTGEIVVRPREPHIMITAYHDMPEATVEAFRNLWFHTGDRGYRDEDGFFFFVDRAKDAIRRRGENISSFEVERVINTHDAVLESCAYGVPSELSEEEVMVAIVLKPDAVLSPEELLDFCQEQMAYFAVPRYVRFVEELPKTPSQRIEKYKLRDEGVTADTWDREEHGYQLRR